MLNKIKLLVSKMISKKILLFLFFVGPMITMRTQAAFTEFELKNVMIHGESNISDFWLKYAGNVKLNLFENKLPADSLQTDKLFELPINEFDAQNNQIKEILSNWLGLINSRLFLFNSMRNFVNLKRFLKSIKKAMFRYRLAA